MKKLFTLLLILIAANAVAKKGTYYKLVSVNKCWAEQKDIDAFALESYKAGTEKEWIALHLSLVEKTLGARNGAHLSTSQKQNRIACLDILHRYWQAENFPINEDYAERTPIFIDKHNNFCAVGFLIKETGNEPIARMISAETNLAYVREMNYPELGIWAEENGFTIYELAWMQPGYPPNSNCVQVGKGVDGFVQELYVDDTAEIMYVGGNFIQADKSFIANNITYVTELGGIYTWHKMADGVNGQVNAITKFDGKIFVAGSFNLASGIAAENLAYWDGTTWQNAGCVDGVVNDLIVYKDTLYAAGNFKSCGADTGKNFAKYNGSTWQIISGIAERINTMEVYGDNLILGGKFNFGTDTNVNIIKWNASSSFTHFGNKMLNEVMDFEVIKDTLYTACKATKSTAFRDMFLKLKDNDWQVAWDTASLGGFYELDDNLAFNTICNINDTINFGGKFRYNPGVGTIGQNCYSNKSFWVTVDSTVNIMVWFKNELLIGGKFKKGNTSDWREVPGSIELNGISKRSGSKLSVASVSKKDNNLKIYPNPAQSGKVLLLENNFSANEFAINSIDGKLIKSGVIDQLKNEIQLPQLPKGIYLLKLANGKGESATSELMIE